MESELAYIMKDELDTFNGKPLVVDTNDPFWN